MRRRNDRLMYDALENLSTKNILILYLITVEGMTHKEIAARIMVDVRSIERRLNKIRATLQRAGEDINGI